MKKRCLNGRRSSNKSKDEARDETSSWKSDDPATKNDEESLVIQGPEAAARQEADRSSGTGDTVGRRHGELELGAGQDSDRGDHLGREITSERHVGDLVAKGFHDVVATGHQLNVDSNASKDQNPD